MVEQQRQRVEQEMTKLVDDIDKQYLRKMQVNLKRNKNSYSTLQSCFSWKCIGVP